MSFKTYGLHCKTVSRHHHLFVNTCHGYFSFTKQTWYHNIFISLLGCDIFSHCIWFRNWLISCGTEVILEEKLFRQIQIRSNTRPKVDICISSITKHMIFFCFVVTPKLFFGVLPMNICVIWSRYSVRSRCSWWRCCQPKEIE